MKCEELLALLNDYVDGNIDPGFCEEFERHMAGCSPCQVVVDNIRKTIVLYREGEPVAPPISFQKQLRECVRARWREKHPTAS